MLKKVLPIVIVILFATTVISCAMIADTMMRSNAEIEDFESLAALIQMQTEEPTGETQNSDSEPTETGSEPIFTRNLNPLYEKNGDCIGWICIPNMFSGLTKYKKQSYYEEHPEGLLITPDCTYRIEFFAGYVASVEDPSWKIGFESDADFELWIKEAQKRSWFTSPLSPAVTDRILTLSTCSYEFDNARYVLHGIIREVNAATD